MNATRRPEQPVFSTLAVLTLAAPMAWAQPADLLKGPEVAPPALPGVERSFGGEMPVVEQTGARRVSMRTFQAAIRTLERHEDEELRLTREQREVARQADRDFRRAVFAFMEEEGMEPQELRRLMQAARDPGRLPAKRPGDRDRWRSVGRRPARRTARADHT